MKKPLSDKEKIVGYRAVFKTKFVGSIGRKFPPWDVFHSTGVTRSKVSDSTFGMSQTHQIYSTFDQKTDSDPLGLRKLYAKVVFSVRASKLTLSFYYAGDPFLCIFSFLGQVSGRV